MSRQRLSINFVETSRAGVLWNLFPRKKGVGNFEMWKLGREKSAEHARRRCGIGKADESHGPRAVFGIVDRNDDCAFDGGMAAKGRLDFFGMDILAAGNKEVVLSPQYAEVAFIVNPAEVARGKPVTFGEWQAQGVVSEITLEEGPSAHENFAVAADTQLPVA